MTRQQAFEECVEKACIFEASAEDGISELMRNSKAWEYVTDQSGGNSPYWQSHERAFRAGMLYGLTRASEVMVSESEKGRQQ